MVTKPTFLQTYVIVVIVVTEVTVVTVVTVLTVGTNKLLSPKNFFY